MTVTIHDNPEEQVPDLFEFQDVKKMELARIEYGDEGEWELKIDGVIIVLKSKRPIAARLAKLPPSRTAPPDQPPAGADR